MLSDDSPRESPIYLLEETTPRIRFKYSHIQNNTQLMLKFKDLAQYCMSILPQNSYFLADPSDGMQRLLNAYTDNFDLPLWEFSEETNSLLTLGYLNRDNHLPVPPENASYVRNISDVERVTSEGKTPILVREFFYNDTSDAHCIPTTDLSTRKQNKADIIKSLINITLMITNEMFVNPKNLIFFCECFSNHIQRLDIHFSGDVSLENIRFLSHCSWDQLRELNLSGDANCILYFLNNSPSKFKKIRHLTISDCIRMTTIESTFLRANQKLNLSSLTNFTLIRAGNKTGDLILGAIDAPSLESLKIEETDVSNDMISIFLKKHSSLFQIHLKYMVTTDLEKLNGNFKLIVPLKNLSTLKIVGTPFYTDSFLEWLSFSPNITHFVFTPSELSFFDESSMIQTMKNLSACLFKKLIRIELNLGRKVGALLLQKNLYDLFSKVAPHVTFKNASIPQRVSTQDPIIPLKPTGKVKFSITQESQKKLTPTLFFKSLHDEKLVDSKYYRINVYDGVTIDTENIEYSPYKDLKLTKLTLLSLQPNDFKSHKKKQHHFEGRCNLSFSGALTSISLPSLNPRESILAITIRRDHFQGEILNNLFDLNYSEAESLHYLTLKRAQTLNVAVAFLLFSSPSPEISPGVNSIYHSIKAIMPIKYTIKNVPCRNLAAYAMEIFSNNLSSQDLDMTMRIITSGVHAYTEICENNIWYRLDWGGVPGEVVPNKSLFLNKPMPILPSAQSVLTEQDLWMSEPETMPINSSFQDLIFEKPVYLLELDPSENINSTIENLIAYLRNAHNRPVFYAESSNQLRCMGPYIQLHETFNALIIQSGGHAGELYNFVERYKELATKPVILINLAHISAAELVQMNKLFEPSRTVQNYSIPAHFTLILIGVNNEYYQGDDFIRRIGKHNIHAFNASMIPKLLLPSFQADKALVKIIEIDLYNSDDWQSLLIGDWSYNETGLNFVPSMHSILNALKESETNPVKLILKNPPFENREFTRFYLLLTVVRAVDFYGLHYEPPITFTIETKQDDIINKDLIRQHQFITCNNVPTDIELVLTNNSFSKLFKDYQFIDNKIISMPGKLFKNRGGHLNLFLTSDIGLNQWRRLLSTAAELRVQLNIIYPEDLTLSIPVQSKKNTALETLCNTKVIISTDYNAEAIHHKKINPSAHVLMLHDLEPNHLVNHVTHTITGDDISFTQKDAALITLLQRGKTVVLVGTPNKVLADQLAEIIIFSRWTHNNVPILLTGNILIITPKRGWVSFLPKNCFIQPKILMGNTQPRFTFSLAYDDISKTFTQNRIQALRNARIISPLIAVSGVTSIGKTSFIYSEEFKQCFDKPIKIYTNLDAWITKASQDPSSEHVYVVDEGNLSEYTMEQLMMLFFNGGSGLVIEHEYQYITRFKDRLTAIITMNPKQYGAGRRSLSILKYAAEVEFPLMPFSYIKEKILLPLLPTRSSASEYLWSGLALLYRIGCEEKATSSTILVTARELAQMIKLIVIEQPISKNTMDDVFIFFAEHLLSEVDCQRFKAEMSIQEAPQEVVQSTITSTYSMTASRVQVYRVLTRFLTLMESEKAINPASSSTPKSGLSGFMLEGISGVGKSAIVEAALNACGYQEISISALLKPLSPINIKSFVKLPVTEDFETRQLVFNAAIEKNVLVWCDEFNANYIDERVLNMALDQGLPLVITQNPANNPMYKGRFKFSPALLRRFIYVLLKPYSPDELVYLAQQHAHNPHFQPVSA